MRVNWGVKARSIDEWERNAIKPYDGPAVPNGVYQWQINICRYVAETNEKLPALFLGLELIPRAGRKDERKYAGYFLSQWMPIADHIAFRYAPFLDAIEASGADFERRTVADSDGNIKRIGAWRHTGKEIILAQMVDGKPDENGVVRKETKWMGPVVEEDVEDDDNLDDEEYDDDDSDDSEDDDEWDDE